MTPVSWSMEASDNRSGTARFYGIGNETPNYNESTYVDDQAALAASIGYNFTRATQIAWGARWRRVDVLPGVLSGVPSIETLYPDVAGLGNEHALEQTLTLTHEPECAQPQARGHTRWRCRERARRRSSSWRTPAFAPWGRVSGGARRSGKDPVCCANPQTAD